MSFIKKNLLKVIEWKNNSKTTIVYRFPLQDRYELTTGLTLVVRDNQSAVFVHKGQVADVFTTGTYTLSTENLPILATLLSLPNDKDSTIKAEIYFVNTSQFINQKWGTKNPIAIRDKDFGLVSLRGYGNYSFKVTDAGLFMKEMFEGDDKSSIDDINEGIRPILISSITDEIASNKLSFIDLAANYKQFGNAVVENSDKNFAHLGIKLEELIVENFSLLDDVEKSLQKTIRPCPKCGEKLSLKTKFCPNCGTKNDTTK